MKNRIGIVVVVILVVIFSVIAFRWIKHRMEYAITDAVFVESDSMANLSFYRVKGKIIKLYKKEGDYVKKGEIIAKIDDTDYRLKLQQLRKQIESLKFKEIALKDKLEKIKKQIRIKIDTSILTKKQIKASIEALRSQLEQVNSQLSLAKKDEERFSDLLKKELIPHRKYDVVKTNLDVLKYKKDYILKKLKELEIGLQKAEEGIKLAKSEEKTVKELENQIKSLSKNIQSLQKKEEDILNLISYTSLKSPYNGQIAKKFVSEGEVIRAGIPVYSVVPENSLYILVLLEETKLEGVKVGNKVNIKIDAYPDLKFRGVVEEINPATAAKFALVPRDVTAGEFTKVAQRIPVKVKITEGDISLLRVGLGGEVEIEKSR
ncbi:HlyD family secretion protein [Persephonella sp.]|uniref:HlyD family secretion protein n=1 Tax=Persephonella sp. TaxID=2060922 RepID=UPI0025F5964E|nr:HlyD family secretion protein [Persephonella sp.]